MGRFEIIDAVESGNLANVKAQVESDPGLVNAADTRGNPILYWAIVHGSEDIAEYLIASGADVNRANLDGQTPLMMASAWDRRSVAEKLIGAGADATASTSTSGACPLHFAADRGRVEIVRLLISYGADPNQKKHDGWTPLHTAAYFGRLSTVQELLNSGADSTVIADDDMTPEAAARAGHHKEVEEYLSKHAKTATSPGDNAIQNGRGRCSMPYELSEQERKEFEQATRQWSRKEFENAFETYMGFAKEGHPESQYIVGRMYFLGEGTGVDTAKAIEWFRLAAELGDEVAQLDLGSLYIDGKVVPKDLKLGAEWLDKASRQGNPRAKYHLGELWAEGLGVPQDDGRALEYWCEAAQLGYPPAEDELRKVARRLELDEESPIGLRFSMGVAISFLTEEDANKGYSEIIRAITDQRRGSGVFSELEFDVITTRPRGEPPIILVFSNGAKQANPAFLRFYKHNNPNIDGDVEICHLDMAEHHVRSGAQVEKVERL